MSVAKESAASFLEVPNNAQYDLPPSPFIAEHEGGTVLINSMGRVITLPPYYISTADVIFPVGFKSMVDPGTKVKYVSEICDLGDRPQFVVTPEDSQERIVGLSASDCWNRIASRVMEKTGSRRIRQLDGMAMFGLSHPDVVRVLHSMVDAEFTALIRGSDHRQKRQRKTNPRFVQSPLKKPRIEKQRFVAPVETAANVIHNGNLYTDERDFVNDFITLFSWLK